MEPSPLIPQQELRVVPEYPPAPPKVVQVPEATLKRPISILVSGPGAEPPIHSPFAEIPCRPDELLPPIATGVAFTRGFQMPCPDPLGPTAAPVSETATAPVNVVDV